MEQFLNVIFTKNDIHLTSSGIPEKNDWFFADNSLTELKPLKLIDVDESSGIIKIFDGEKQFSTSIVLINFYACKLIKYSSAYLDSITPLKGSMFDRIMLSRENGKPVEFIAIDLLESIESGQVVEAPKKQFTKDDIDRIITIAVKFGADHDMLKNYVYNKILKI